MRPLIAAAAVLTAAALAAIAQPAGAGRVAAVQPPVIHERFTLLPCPANPQTTLESEGCAEHRIVRADKKIDAAAKAIFALLPDDAARRHYVTAHKAWLAYRRADCASVSDKYAGGTLAGVLDADCTADRSEQRLKDVRAQQRLLESS
jgi:uncharacterized protein YecT (DUF1311 family)